MEKAEWGHHRPLSVTPDEEPLPEGPPPPSLFSLAVAEPESRAAPAPMEHSSSPAQQPEQQKTVPRASTSQAKEEKIMNYSQASDDQQSTPLRIFKVVMIGDSGVGKTTFIERLCKGQVNRETRSTVGVDFFSKMMTVDDQQTSLKLWDTAGTERYHSISRSFLRDADGVILMYDVTNQTSFSNVNSWMVDIQEKAREGVVVMVTGNKTDSASEGSAAKKVPFKVGEGVANSYKALFVELSSLRGDGIQAACEVMVRALHKMEDNQLKEVRRVALVLAEGGCADDSFLFDKKKKPVASGGCCG